MKYFIFLMALVAGNSHILNPKICINCRNFIGFNLVGNKYGKCKAFPIIKEEDGYLITGNITKCEIDYYYCSDARKDENKCGENALKYVEDYLNK
jgi:hypothetical protein